MRCRLTTASPCPCDVPVSNAQPAPRARSRQTAVDMVRTLVVIVAFVAVVLLLVPQEPAVEQPAVAPAEVQAAADRDTERLGFEPVVTTVAADWQTDFVRTERRVDDVLQWRLGLRSPGGARVDIEQTEGATERWLLRPDDGPAGDVEPVTVAGTRWDRFVRGDDATAYAFEREEVTTMVSANEDGPELVAAVQAVTAELTETG